MSGSHPFSRRSAAFGLGTTLISVLGQSIFIGLFGTQIRSELDLSPSAWGALYGIATAIGGMLMFWLGAMVDRVPATRAISLALLILAAGAGTMAIAQTPWMLALAFFGLRLGGQGLCLHIAIVTAARHARLRGSNIAIATFGLILGEAIFPFMVAALLGWTDWRWIWAGAASVVLLAALPVLRQMAAPLPQDPPNHTNATTGSMQEDTMRRRDLLRRPAFLAALPVVLLFPFIVTSIFLHQGSISALRGWSASQIAIGYLCFAGTQAISTWLAGRLVDQRGAISLFRFYLLPLAAGVLLGAFAPSDIAVWGLYLGLGLASGGQSVTSGALWAELFGIRRLGLVRGVYTALMVLSTAASPPLLGMALQAQVSLMSMAVGVALFAVVMPLLLAHALRPSQSPATST